MNPMPPHDDTLHHHARRMGGRDPNQLHRVATPLELLFDLTFVIAFGLAASQFAHALAEGHLRTALIGFSFASFAISWPGSISRGSPRRTTPTIGFSVSSLWCR
jgi:hypothetical protein